VGCAAAEGGRNRCGSPGGSRGAPQPERVPGGRRRAGWSSPRDTGSARRQQERGGDRPRPRSLASYRQVLGQDATLARTVIYGKGLARGSTSLYDRLPNSCKPLDRERRGDAGGTAARDGEAGDPSSRSKASGAGGARPGGGDHAPAAPLPASRRLIAGRPGGLPRPAAHRCPVVPGVRGEDQQRLWRRVRGGDQRVHEIAGRSGGRRRLFRESSASARSVLLPAARALVKTPPLC
jgi:hypothetical protein